MRPKLVVDVIRHLAVILVAMCTVLAPTSSLLAQGGMEFSAGEVEEESEASTQPEVPEEDLAPPPPQDPPEDTPPSAALQKNLKLFKDKKYASAAIGLQGIIDGQPSDTPGNVQEAQFVLGKALFQLELYQSALTIFDEISQMGTGHLFHTETLEWLAELAKKLPEPAKLSEKIGRYGLDELGRFNNTKNRKLYNELLFRLGKHKYNRGKFGEAANILGRVVRTSKRYVESKFVQGISFVQLRKAKPATRAFRDIIEAIDEGEVDSEEEERFENLAWLSLARVYYTAANKVNSQTGDRKVDARLLGNAVTSWNRVSTSSEYWLDSLFEASWAFFLADEYARALGNIHTIFSPYFEDSYYPEAYVIKAVTFFVNCQVDNARALVGQFHERFDPVQSQMESELRRYKSNEAFFNFLKKVRDGKDTLSPEIRPIIKGALSDRALLRNVEYVAAMKDEEARLKKLPRSFQGSAVGARIVQDIAIAKAFAVDQTGDLARARFDRALSDLRNLQNQMDTIDLEITTFQRGQLSQELQQQQRAAKKSKGGDVEVDEEHQVWPFDGEYWRDELGFYRQQVTNRCGR